MINDAWSYDVSDITNCEGQGARMMGCDGVGLAWESVMAVDGMKTRIYGSGVG